MITYYTSVILMCWLALGALGYLVHRNNRIPLEGKKLFYLTYTLVALAALAEWCGVLLNGQADYPLWLLRAIKCADYILTPAAGGALVLQMRLNNRWQRFMLGVLIGNTVLQLVAVPFGWIAAIDAQHHYTHGPLFCLYFAVCLVIYGLVILQYTIYSRSYSRQNRGALLAVMLVVMGGICLQELADVRTAYLGMTLGAALMFIHYTEFSQLAMDDYITRQELALDTDALTGLYSRYAYSQTLNAYDDPATLPAGFAAFAVDINSLKHVNDTLGHVAGDELIAGAAACLKRVFGENVRCCRTGGDEFVALGAPFDTQSADLALRALYREADGFRGRKGQRLSFAAGYALAEDYPACSAEALVSRADEMMYEAKKAYYRKTGRSRRKAR